MTNRVLIKRSSVANSVPSASALEYGEFALNYADGNLFFKNSSNVVTTLASTQFVNVSGNANVGNIGATNAVITNALSAGNITVSGNVSATVITGTLTTAVQTNILQVGQQGYLDVAGNITAGNVFSFGNIVGNYFLGNGSLLTGISSNSIYNGNSNVAIASASANVTMDINGDANTVVISPGSIFVNGLFASPKTITSNVQMAADSTAMIISPLTIASGYSMSIPTSSTVYVWIPS